MIAARRLLPLFCAWVGLLLVFQAWVPRGNFLTFDNMVSLAQQVSVDNALLAFGMTLVILVGGIDLSVGATVALAGVVSVTLLKDVGTPLAVLAGLATGFVVGAANGLFASRTQMPSFIITLATSLIVRGIAFRFNNNQPIQVPDEAEGFIAIANGRFLDWLPYPVLIAGVIFLAAVVLLHRTRFGQHLYAIGGNREAARFTGIRVARHEFTVYAISGTLAGVVGILMASQLRSAIPSAGMGFELNAIAAVVVGGTSFTGGIGTMPGTLLGVVIIGTLNKGLNQAQVHYSFQEIVKGAVILAAVWFDVRQRKRKE